MNASLGFVLILVASVAMAGAPPNSDGAEWPLIRDAEEHCKTQLFGDLTEFRRSGGEGLVVVVRLLNQCERDRQLVLTDIRSQVSLSSTSVLRVSIEEHLEERRRKDPDVSLDRACSTIPVDRTTLSEEAHSGALRKLVDQLGALRISPTFPTSFVPHGTHYRIWIFSGSTFSHFRFSGISGSPDSELQAWTDSLIQLAGESPENEE